MDVVHNTGPKWTNEDFECVWKVAGNRDTGALDFSEAGDLMLGL